MLDGDTAQRVSDYAMDRFRAWYEDQGVPVAVLRAVIATGVTCPAEVDRRVQALTAFIGTEAATALAAANKRVANILAKSEDEATGKPDPALFEQPAEQQLHDRLLAVQPGVQTAVASGDFGHALAQLANLQDPVDAFFDEVMVNADDPAIRNNRLQLLAALRNAFTGIADFALLSGAGK